MIIDRINEREIYDVDDIDKGIDIYEDDIKKMIKDELNKEYFKEILKEKIKQEVDEQIKDGKKVNNIVNYIKFKDVDEEEVEEMREERKPVEGYILCGLFIMVITFAMFYESFVNNNLSSEVIDNSNLQESTVFVSPEVEQVNIENEEITGIDVNSKEEDIIESLFSFADRDEEKELFDFNNNNIESKDKVKNKLLSIFNAIKEIVEE